MWLPKCLHIWVYLYLYGYFGQDNRIFRYTSKRMGTFVNITVWTCILGWWESKLFVEYIYEPWCFYPHRSLRLRPLKDFLIGWLHQVSQDDGLFPRILCYITIKKYLEYNEFTEIWSWTISKWTCLGHIIVVLSWKIIIFQVCFVDM